MSMSGWKNTSTPSTLIPTALEALHAKPRLKFLSLFAGIGGFDLGLERAGMECIGQVEIDPFCRKVLAKHWSDVPRHDDVKTFTEDTFDAKPDLICGGFPCQPVSRAGNQLAQGDPRWFWPEFRRIIHALGPGFVIVENTTGLFDGGFGDVLRDLAEIGFDAEWCVLSACAFGAPHTRERVFIFAYRHEIGWDWPGRDLDRRHEVLPRREWEAAPNCSEWRDVERWLVTTFQDGRWEESPGAIRGMDDGIPDGMDRIGSTGNAVLPQIAEYIGRRITDRIFSAVPA